MKSNLVACPSRSEFFTSNNLAKHANKCPSSRLTEPSDKHHTEPPPAQPHARSLTGIADPSIYGQVYRTCPKCKVSMTANNLSRHVCCESKKTETCPNCELTFFATSLEGHVCGASGSSMYRACAKCKVSLAAAHFPSAHVCSESKKKETCAECKRTFYAESFERHLCDASSVDARQTFAVERVVASRLNALGKEEYKVRWQGYAERDDTWEPVEHFLPGVIDEFKGSKVPPLERLT